MKEITMHSFRPEWWSQLLTAQGWHVKGCRCNLDKNSLPDPMPNDQSLDAKCLAVHIKIKEFIEYMSDKEPR